MATQAEITTAISTLKSFDQYQPGSFSAEGLLSLALLYNKASEMVTQAVLNTTIAEIKGYSQFLPGSYSTEGLFMLALLSLLGEGGGGGGSVAVEDDGASVVAATTILNFTGAGVVVTDGGGGQADIAIADGGSPDIEGSLITITAGSPTATIADGVNYQPVLLENNATLTLPTQTDRHLIQVEVLEDATGDWTITFDPPATYSIIWDGSTSAPQLNTAANKQTNYMFAYTPGSTVIRGVRNFYPA